MSVDAGIAENTGHGVIVAITTDSMINNYSQHRRYTLAWIRINTNNK